MRHLIAIVGLAWPLLATTQSAPTAHGAAESGVPAGFLRGSAIGFSVDRFAPAGVRLGDGLTTVSLHITSLAPRQVGLDAAIGMWPEALRYNGLIVMGADVGGAYNISVPGATLLLKAGPSVLVAVGGFGGTGLVGGHLGGGAIIRLNDDLGLRADVVEHYYYVGRADGGFRAASLSLGITSLKPNETPYR
ncbi:MAG: hypothetical protein ACR2OG_07740 [Gemmatimonadaceae bacterium]